MVRPALTRRKTQTALGRGLLQANRKHGAERVATNPESLAMKYIFVTGGVVSSLGKGLTAASLGTLLEAARSAGRFPESSILI